MERLVYEPNNTTEQQLEWASTVLDHPSGYLAGEGLTQAVNVALALEKPLLLTGEPGTGKTQLAYSLAYSLGLSEPLKLEAKSSMEQRDFFYNYDAVGRFHAAQERHDSSGPDQYIVLQALGLAIAKSRDPADDTLRSALPDVHALARHERTVVLIDEIDKAPRDVPNDVLNEIESMYFRIRECANTIITGNRDLKPIVIFTSNSERFLPDAFLRRCVFYDIPFPNDEQLDGIIANRLHRGLSRTDPMVNDCITFLRFLRSPEAGIARRPGPAELLDWIKALLASGAQATQPLASMRPLALSTSCAIVKSRDDQAVIAQLFDDWCVGPK